MKAPNTHLFAKVAMIATLTSAAAWAQPAAVIDIRDDITLSEEQALERGIQRAAIEDLQAFVAAVAGKEAILNYEMIGESAEAQPTVSLALSAFSLQPPTPPNIDGLGLPEITAVTERYIQDKRTYLQSRDNWQATTRENGTQFIEAALSEQLRTAVSFDGMLNSRGGKDYNRSDISGSILEAGKFFSQVGGARFLVLNSDLEDAPGSGQKREEPIRADEFPLDSYLIIVGKPKDTTLISNFPPDRVAVVQSLTEAAALIAQATQ